MALSCSGGMGGCDDRQAVTVIEGFTASGHVSAVEKACFMPTTDHAPAAEHVAASSTLTAHCARVLHTTREPGVATLALSAVLTLLDPSHTLFAQRSTLEELADAADAPQRRQIAALTDDALRLPSRETLAHAFVRHHFSRWAATLLDVGLLDWRGALTAAEASSLFDSHLLRAPPRGVR